MKNTQKYFYYLHHSPTFIAEKKAHNRLIKDGAIIKAGKQMKLLINKYKIPKNAVGYFIYLVISEENIFSNVSIHEVGDGHKWSLAIEGPAIAMVFKKHTSEREFRNLWKRLDKIQSGYFTSKTTEVNLTPVFQPNNNLRKKSDFDEVFKWYQMRETKDKNGKLTSYSQIQNVEKLPANKDRKYIQSRVEPLKKLIKAMHDENK